MKKDAAEVANGLAVGFNFFAAFAAKDWTVLRKGKRDSEFLVEIECQANELLNCLEVVLNSSLDRSVDHALGLAKDDLLAILTYIRASSPVDIENVRVLCSRLVSRFEISTGVRVP